MRRSAKFLFSLCNAGILLTVVWIFCVYATPWIEGSGSVLKPVDDVTHIFQELDPTGLLEFSIEAPKKVTDTVFSILTLGRTEQQLSGYDIPLAENASIRKMRPLVFLIYLPLLIAVACFAASLKGNGKMPYDFACLFLASLVFFVSRALMLGIRKEGLFITIQSSDGFALMVLSFLGIAVISAFKILFHFSLRPEPAP